MDTDEQAIRDLITTWHSATAKGDLARLLTLTPLSAAPRIPFRIAPFINGIV